ncbi:hypothetical protein [Paraburkholderia rhizosphaerae]|uniref:Lipoprotein n=1 Tax=Paraburkholderia rhizosphaerae TaxID=480658 RepID=A0A4R8LIG9_9BURK|nr:hypothetical protein [Paraburkholderia rhizosphaerae]TDY43223.1 hypothetical protein BX592_11818 [Paraburkholderia rhizosphaerae]
MTRLLITLALIGGLCGCVVAPPYGYAPAPAYYGYPAYYYGPPVSVGIGGSFHIR